MNPLLVMVPLNLLGIGLYLNARWKNDLKRVALIQPATVILSWLIAATSLLRTERDIPLAVVVLLGMGIAIVGDFLNLNMEDPNVVMRGLVIAVLAYLTYGIGLAVLNGFHQQDVWVGLPLLAFYLLLMRHLWPGLGQMRIPALIYGLVLPFAFWRAAATFFGDRFTFQQALLLSAGTLSLYTGDIEFAIHTFKRRIPVMFGPIFYAGGQLLIALSLWFG